MSKPRMASAGPSRHPLRTRRAHFNLVELVVVVTILMGLAAVVIPPTYHVLQMPKTSLCVDNLGDRIFVAIFLRTEGPVGNASYV